MQGGFKLVVIQKSLAFVGVLRVLHTLEKYEGSWPKGYEDKGWKDYEAKDPSKELYGNPGKIGKKGAPKPIRRRYGIYDQWQVEIIFWFQKIHGK